MKPIDEFDIIKSLRLSSIKYSACSSFAALSGNSDLKLHSTIRDKEVENELEEENEMEKGNAEVIKTSATKGPSEKVEETENNEKCELEDEVDDIEPINHFLKVKAHLLRFIFYIFYNSSHCVCSRNVGTVPSTRTPLLYPYKPRASSFSFTCMIKHGIYSYLLKAFYGLNYPQQILCKYCANIAQILRQSRFHLKENHPALFYNTDVCCGSVLSLV